VKLNTQPVVGDTFADRDPGLADGRSQLYAAAPLYRGAASRVTEGPRVMLRVALAPVPLGWMGTSINEGLRSGSVLFDARTALDGQIVLRGSGEDISGAADGCYFLSQPVEGDFQLTVQALTRPAATHAWAKAGLMLRESLQPGARNASLFTTAESGLTYQWRPAANDLTESKAVLEHAGLKLPILLRITRRGNTISTEYSMDYGKRFHPADDPFPFQPPLPEAIYAGLAITAHDPAQVSEAKFSGLEVRKR